MALLHCNESKSTPFGAESEVQVNEESDGWEVPAEAYPVLYKLARKWTDVTGCRNLRLKPLKGAMTNQIFQCKWDPTNKGEKSRKVLVRVYGESSELFFNREGEILTFERMSQHGQGPRLLARFPNGRVEEFLQARTLSAEDLRNPEISNKIAVKLRQFHELKMPGPVEPNLWQRLRAWFQKTVELASPAFCEEFSLNLLGEEIIDLEKKLRHPGEIIGFCHNDLQYGNIMINENDHVVTLIDYEYASFNPVAFDIANHFCEMAANYHSDTPHVLDYSQYPDCKERLRFVRTYLQASEKLITVPMALTRTCHPYLICYIVMPPFQSRETGDEIDVESLMRAVDLYTLASHLHWVLWGFISALTSDIDFNYLEYARQRVDQYHMAKSSLLENAQHE